MKIDFKTDDTEEYFTSLNIASALINHKSKYESIMAVEKEAETFELEDLEEIANHLLVYCEAERKRRGFNNED